MAEQTQTEKERQQKMLIVLGVFLFLAGAFNFKHIKKLFGGRRSKVVRRRGGSSGGRSRSRGRSRTARGGRKKALSPDAIPTLDEHTKSRLNQLGSRRPDLIPEAKLRYETRNPFLPLNVSQRDIDNKKKGKTGKAVSHDALYFRGLLTVDEKRYAIIERPDRKLPWYAQPGETLRGTNFKLLNISEDEKLITVENPDAKRERDRIKTIPRSDQARTLALAKVLSKVSGRKPLLEKVGGLGAAPGLSQTATAAGKGTPKSTAKDAGKGKADDDFSEIFE